MIMFVVCGRSVVHRALMRRPLDLNIVFPKRRVVKCLLIYDSLHVY